MISCAKIIQIKPNSTIYIHAAKALSGPDLSPAEDLLLVVENGRISGLEFKKQEDIAAEVKNSPHYYSLHAGLTLMPCLADAHVHLALNGKGLKSAERERSVPGLFRARLKDDLAAIAAMGIGFVRDGGDSLLLNLEAKDMVENNSYAGPKVIATGEALRASDGYGSFLGRGFSSRSELVSQIEKLTLCGVDQVKVVLSGVVSFSKFGVVEGPLMPLEDLVFLVNRARELKLKVMGHASSEKAVNLAIEAGVDSVEHGYFLSRDSLKKMAAKGIAWVPTVIPVAAQVRPPLLGGKSPGEVELIRRTCREQLEKIVCAHEVGVTLGIGTDSGALGVDHGCALIDEILLYSECGLPASAVLKSATVNNAVILGCEKDAGFIEKGKKPHLIAVQGNPLYNIEAVGSAALHFMPVTGNTSS
jgi:imidazolonepropionase-like amidohydrolase